MNKHLLTALFTVAFSGIMFAQAPDYTFLSQELYEYCSAYGTPTCVDIAAMHATMQERKAVEPTQEEQEQLETLKIALKEEFDQFNARKTNLLHSAATNNNEEIVNKILKIGTEIKQEEAQDLSEKLNSTDSADSKE